MSLHLVIGQQDCKHHALEEVVARAIQGGVTHVQLREKQAATRDFLAIGKRLQGLLKANNIPLIINDRVDIALALDADGVHVGQADMPYPEVRRLLGAHKIIGVTIENPEQMQQANQWAVQYVGVGPIFATQTKLDTPAPLAMAGLATLRTLSRHPLIAIGGINATNAQVVMKAGADGIAVVSAISHARYPERASRLLKSIVRATTRRDE